MPSKARAAFFSGISFFSFFFREKTGDYRFRETAHPPKNEIFRVSVFLPAKIFIRDEIEGKSLISRFCKNKVGEDVIKSAVVGTFSIFILMFLFGILSLKITCTK